MLDYFQRSTYVISTSFYFISFRENWHINNQILVCDITVDYVKITCSLFICHSKQNSPIYFIKSPFSVPQPQNYSYHTLIYMEGHLSINADTKKQSESG